LKIILGKNGSEAMLQIVEINPKDKKTFKKFVDFPNKLYAGSPHYVPPMFGDEMSLIDAKKNVAYDECDFKYFLCYKDGDVVGRVAAILQHAANDKWGNKNMRFSRFDFVNDIQVVKGLLNAVEEFAKEKGMTLVHGPFGLNDMDREGLLTQGFDRKATLATNYNYDYYADLVQKCGYEQEFVWNEYLVQLGGELPEKVSRVCEIAEKRFGLRLPDEQKLKVMLDKYATGLFDLYDEAYSVLAGTMPLTGKMRRQMLSQFKVAINVNYLPIVVNGKDEVVAFGLAFPDITEPLMKKGGRLTMPIVLDILKRVKKPKSIEFALIGAKPGYDRQGAAALVMKQFAKYMKRDGIMQAESNPELETNVKVQALWSSFDHELIKKRATYSKEVR